MRHDPERYRSSASCVRAAPADADVVMPGSRDRIAPLLRALRPRSRRSASGFRGRSRPTRSRFRATASSTAIRRFFPAYRGPSPVVWAIRNGENEIGFTFHYMDAELDTGNVLAQARVPLGRRAWLGGARRPSSRRRSASSCPAVLERVERGDPGDPQDESGASYFRLFEPEYAWIDWSKPLDEIERQVRAWRFHSRESTADRGALTEIDGETVRVLRVSLEPADGRAMECADGTLWIVETEAA